MRRLEQKVLSFIEAQGLFKPAEKVLLACSGGADSTVLLHIITAIKKKGRLPVEICCAHINHGLRGAEADRDENFVIEQCRKLNIPVIIKKIDVKKLAREEKLSIETAARILRIKNLLEIAQRQDCSCVATAHQKNDNAETIIQRMSRGTGFQGLCGIWPVKQFGKISFVRPLLCVDRGEIIQYLNDCNLKWCHDRTNEDLAYKRNFIRHSLIPFLQKDWRDSLVNELFELSMKSLGFNRLINTLADNIWPVVAAIDKQNASLNSIVFDNQLPEVKIVIIRRVFARLGYGEQDLTQQHFEKILNLRDKAVIQLPQYLEMHRQGNEIIVKFSGLKKSQEKDWFPPPKQLNIPGQIKYSSFQIKAEIFDYGEDSFKNFKETKSNYIEWFDLDKIKLPVLVRFRKQGDKFWPLGMAGEKKVGKFLTTAKVPDELRQKMLVIEDAEKIIWLCPVRAGEQSKITGKTRKVLQLRTDSQTG